jgi:glutathione S-transferase
MEQGLNGLFREDKMKLYMHPVSTVCRPIRLLAAESGIEMEEEVVDLMSGAHHQPLYAAMNPSRQVPLLVDGDLTLTEGSAILKYLAEKFQLAAYPKDIKKRAKVNEIMDWLNTGFYRDFGYNLVYPQLFPHHKRRSDEAHSGTLEWGRERSRKWLQILNDHWLGPNNQYLGGNDLTIADYFGAGLVSIGELICCDFADYPNVRRWLSNMKKLRHWNKVNEVFSGFVAGNQGKEFAVL